MDPLFRQRLKLHYRDLTTQLATLERGTPAWFDCDRAIMATSRLYATLFREAVQPVHSQPAYRPDAKDPPPG